MEMLTKQAIGLRMQIGQRLAIGIALGFAALSGTALIATFGNTVLFGKNESPSSVHQAFPLIERTRNADGSVGYTMDKNGNDTLEVHIVPGEAVVRFADTTFARSILTQGEKTDAPIRTPQNQELNAIFNDFSITHAKSISDTVPALQNVIKLSGNASTAEATLSFIDALKKLPSVTYAEPNYYVTTDALPNDTYADPDQNDIWSTGAWGQDFPDLWGLEKIDVEQAWDTTQGEGIIVAVSDTGVDYDHPDIAENIWTNSGETGTDALGNDKATNGIDDDENGYIDDWHGWDFCRTDPQDLDDLPEQQVDNDPMDLFGHGTHVAGTIAAIKNNNEGIVGVAPQAKIMAIRGLNQYGDGALTDLAEGVIYAADTGADVINMSWGGWVENDIPTYLQDAIEYAHNKGVTLVAASGNNGLDIKTENFLFVPAILENVIVVAATDSQDIRPYWSNWGEKLDIAAPGGGDLEPTSAVNPFRSILSLKAIGASSSFAPSSLHVGDDYVRQAGTSMASPHVAGVTALLLAEHPDLTPWQVRSALRTGADTLQSDESWIPKTGYGRLSANGALTIQHPIGVHLSDLPEITSGSSLNAHITVQGDDIQTWRLEYTDPTYFQDGWITITSGVTAVTDEIFPWDISVLPEKNYVLRLYAVNSAGEEFIDKQVVYLDRILLTSPEPMRLPPFPILHPDEIIPITGTANEPQLEQYSLTVDGLPNAHIVLTNDGTQPVNDGILGYWDTTGVTPGYYTLTLSVQASHEYGSGDNGNHFTQVLFLEPQAAGNWPLSYGGEAWQNDAYSLSEAFISADILGNGNKEILVGYGQHVNILTATGESLPGWPQSFSASSLGDSSLISSTPAAGDVDGDGMNEIISYIHPLDGRFIDIYVWKADGTLLPGWPKTVNLESVPQINNPESELPSQEGETQITESPEITSDATKTADVSTESYIMSTNGTIDGSPAIADINGDGKKEIIIFAWGHYGSYPDSILLVLDQNGNELPGWPKAVDNPLWPYFVTTPTIGNIDASQDGTQEIVVASDSTITALSSIGDVLFSHEAYSWDSKPSLGDLDGDGDLEVIQAEEWQVNAWHHDGTPVNGWPVTFERHIAGNPAIGDLNSDGNDDVVVTANHSEWGPNGWQVVMYGLKSDGTDLPGWPVIQELTHCNGMPLPDGFYTPIIADVSGDGSPDVLAAHAACQDLPEPLDAYSAQGQRLAGFPKKTSDIPLFSGKIAPLVDDFNNDGLLELFWADEQMEFYLWQLNAGAQSPRPWPMAPHDAQATSAVDMASPTVHITSPTNGQIVKATVTLQAEASDNTGIAKVEFSVDGTKRLGVDAVAPYSLAIATNTLKNGIHTFTVRAYDYTYNTADATIQLYVNNPTSPPPRNPPKFELYPPAE